MDGHVHRICLEVTRGQAGAVLFWLVAGVLLTAFLFFLLGIRIQIRVPARALVVLSGVLVGGWLLLRAAATLPAEVIGGWLIWGLLAGMWVVLFWLLIR